MTVRELATAHGLTPVVLPDPEREVQGCYIGDLLSWVMGKAQTGNVWITIMTNVNTVAVAALTDVSVVLLAEGVQLEKPVLDCAEARGVNVLSTSLSAFDAALLLQRDV